MIKKSDELAIAVSGGKDSMSAVHLFNSLGMDFHVLHCNFKLRGEESDLDERFVIEQCRALEHCQKVYTRSFDTQDYAEEKGISTQEAARELRYNYFDSLCQVGVFSKLVTAHQQNDNVETFLINAYRVSGSKGLAGIPVQRDYLIRPMLALSEAEIKDYIKTHNIEFREDSSNTSNKYLRNIFRNLILPGIGEHLPDFFKRIDQTSSNLRTDSDLLSFFVERDKTEILTEESESYAVAIQTLETYPHRHVFLYYLLDDFGFTLSQCTDVLTANTGAEFLSDTHKMLKDRDIIRIVKNAIQSELNLEIIGPGKHDTDRGTLEIREVSKADLGADQNTEYAAISELKYPLALRYWQEGDFIYPLGMDHKKLLSDFFIDSKIDRNSKHQIPLLASGNEVFWIIGHRLSNKLKLKALNDNCLELRFVSKP